MPGTSICLFSMALLLSGPLARLYAVLQASMFRHGNRAQNSWASTCSPGPVCRCGCWMPSLVWWTHSTAAQRGTWGVCCTLCDRCRYR